MDAALRLRDPRALFWAAAVGVYALSATVVRTLPGFDNLDRIAAAVAFDLTVTVTALAWLLPVRGGRWPLASLVPIFCVGVFAARHLLPTEAVGTLAALGLVAAVAEAGLLGWIALRARRGVAAARQGGVELDRLARLRHGARVALWSRAASEAIAFELAVLAYALGRRRAPHVPPGRESFAYHRRIPYGPVVAALGLVVLAETVPFHFVIARWSERAAWIVTACGLYTLLYLVADWRATSERPILLDDETLVVRTGLRWTVEIPRAAITAVERRAPAGGERPLRAAILGGASLWIHLDRPVLAIGPYGRRRSVTSIALAVDEPERFLAALARAV